VALVAQDLARTRDDLERGIGIREPYADPGVGVFGLDNAVYEVGSDFLEVVSPHEDGTTAGRLLERRGDGGYMAIFQVSGFDELRRVRDRLGDLGVRVVWDTDLDDIATTHLHPKDMAGAIVSVDASEPAATWRWAGPRWTGAAPASPFAGGGIAGITVEVTDPAAAADVWSSVLACPLDPLPSGQYVRFAEGSRGIVDVDLALSSPEGSARVGTATVRTRPQEAR
jgi:hypothetical protein